MPRGVRIDPKHDARTRAKIQTSQIINRLEKLVNGEVTMTAQQVRAAEILLRKTLPDLSAVEYAPADPTRDTLREVLAAIDGQTAGLPSQDASQQTALV
jgi:hypothetical protein